MKLREIIEKANGGSSVDWGYLLEYEVVVHQAGEVGDDVVDVELVPQIKSIYLEYE
jgi:hypothetical protein